MCWIWRTPCVVTKSSDRNIEWYGCNRQKDLLFHLLIICFFVTKIQRGFSFLRKIVDSELSNNKSVIYIYIYIYNSVRLHQRKEYKITGYVSYGRLYDFEDNIIKIKNRRKWIMEKKPTILSVQIMPRKIISIGGRVRMG